MELTRTLRWGPTPECPVCLAGAFVSFNWSLADEAPGEGPLDPLFQMPARGSFVLAETLRRGSLYRCKACQRHWHLDAGNTMMSHVLEDRIPLIQAWNRAAILLPASLREKVGTIGATPPDLYGNGQGFIQTPCGVITRDAERIDLAILSIQSAAPFEQFKRCRLGSDIADVYPSPFALPLDVRVATSRAPEAKMGSAPTIIEMPDSRLFVLNWRPEFLIEDGYDAGQAKISVRRPDMSKVSQVTALPANVIYFVADG